MSANKSVLGRGLESLVPINVPISTVVAQKSEKLHQLDITKIVPKNDQPRQNFDELALNQLAMSIKQQGILQPLVVKQIEQNKYSIIAGERRWRAAKIANLKIVPAIVRDVDTHQHLELSLLENVQRADLNPMETAQTVYRLHTEFNQSYENIALRLGKAYTTVMNLTRLLALPKSMQQAVSNGTISEGHARALLALNKFPKKQLQLFNSIIAKNLSVRQAEQLASIAKNNYNKTSKKTTLPSEIDKQISEIASKTGYKIKLSQAASGSGRVTISYQKPSQLKAILNGLSINNK